MTAAGSPVGSNDASAGGKTMTDHVEIRSSVVCRNHPSHAPPITLPVKSRRSATSGLRQMQQSARFDRGGTSEQFYEKERDVRGGVEPGLAFQAAGGLPH